MNKTITLLIIGVIFLALLLMVLNSFVTEERHGVPVSLSEQTRPQENVPPARIPEERAVSAPEAQNGADAVSSRPQSAESAAVARAPSTEGVAVKTVPAQIDSGQTAPADPPPQTAAPPPPPQVSGMPEPGARQTGGGAKNITNIVVYATQEGATLRFGGDRPLVYKSMLLRNPDRLVIDFEGQWNVNIPGVPQNKLVKALRVGRQADATRMVVDLHREPVSYRLIKLSPQRLEVRLR